MTVSAILLAAGLSTRMGQNKALLPWNGQILLEYHLEQLRQTKVDSTIVVLGYEADKLRPYVERDERVSVVVNPDYLSGRCGSIKTGVMALPSTENSVMILSVDQPRPYRLLEELVAYHDSHGNLITVPVFEGKSGHPPIFSSKLIPELLDVSEEKLGLHNILYRYKIQVAGLPVSSPVAIVNLNNMEDYEKALHQQNL